MADRGSDIKIGNVLEHKGNLYLVVKTAHTQPGKGGAYIQAEMKNLKTGSKQNERFRADGEVNKVRLEEEYYNYLYSLENTLTLMNSTTFEQITIDEKALGDKKIYLQDNMVILVASYNHEVIYAKVPDTLILTVIEADAVIKGQTASASYKPAVLDNGLRISVPPFVKSGDRVVVNTIDDTYLERAKDL